MGHLCLVRKTFVTPACVEGLSPLYGRYMAAICRFSNFHAILPREPRSTRAIDCQGHRVCGEAIDRKLSRGDKALGAIWGSNKWEVTYRKTYPGAGRHRGRMPPAPGYVLPLPIVTIAPSGSRHRWAHGHQDPGQHPRLLAGGEA